MVILASTSFLTRRHARTHARTPGKPIYRGETGSPKNSPKKSRKGQNGAKLKIKIGQFWKILAQTKPNRTKKVEK